MAERAVAVHLESSGAPPTLATGQLRLFSPVERLARAVGLVLLGLVLAVALLPFPIIHLIGPPVLVLVSLLVAVRQARARGRLAPLRLPCPRCGAPNQVGGGLGVRDPDAPRPWRCESCRRILTLSVHPTTASAGGG